MMPALESPTSLIMSGIEPMASRSASLAVTIVWRVTVDRSPCSSLICCWSALMSSRACRRIFSMRTSCVSVRMRLCRR